MMLRPGTEKRVSPELGVWVSCNLGEASCAFVKAEGERTAKSRGSLDGEDYWKPRHGCERKERLLTLSLWASGSWNEAKWG